MTTTGLALTLQFFETARIAVHRFRGKEGISRLFKFDVEVEVDDGPLAAALAASAAPPFESDLVLGLPAVFTFGAEVGSLRHIHGVVSRVRRLERRSSSGPVFALRIVPRLAMRRHQVMSRVFQNYTVPQAVEALLAKSPGGYAQVGVSWLTRKYPVREYIVQYRESDLDFVRRILAEAGIYWYFERSVDASHTGSRDAAFGPVIADPQDVMILKDGPHYPSLSEPSPLLERSSRSAPVVQRIDSFEPAGRVRPSAVLLREYDLERPARPVVALATRRSGDVEAIGLAQAWEKDSPLLRVVEHESDVLEIGATEEEARCRVEQYQQDVFLSRGRSAARHLVPGYRFRVSPFDDDVAEEYVVTRLVHRGIAPEHAGGGDVAYENELEAVPARVPFRPKRPKKRMVQVLESAVVTGLEDGSVHADEHGRVRVQFHWDLTGQADETSTTWLRVLQPWAGAAHGVQFIPRVGMEVMVSFVGGDPDCPVVLGAVHNRTHPPPFQTATGDPGKPHGSNLRSGIRTASYPGGNGFNELSFEDLAGEEQVYLHAQRDFDAVVRRNQSLAVDKCQHVEIGESQTCHVGDRKVEKIGGSAERHVGGDDVDEIRGGRTTAVDGSDVTSVGKERRIRVGVDDRLEVEGRQSSWVKGDRLTRTDGNAVVVVGSAKAPRGFAARVEGTADVSISRMLEIASETGIRLRCGRSVVEIMPASIDIFSPVVNVRSPNAVIATKEDHVTAEAKTRVALTSTELVEIASELGGRLALDAAFAARGATIDLARPKPSVAATELAKSERTTVVLRDRAGAPLPTTRFVLALEDGSERSFVTDQNGECDVPDLAGSASVRVPDHVDVAAGGVS